MQMTASNWTPRNCLLAEPMPPAHWFFKILLIWKPSDTNLHHDGSGFLLRQITLVSSLFKEPHDRGYSRSKPLRRTNFIWSAVERKGMQSACKRSPPSPCNELRLYIMHRGLDAASDVHSRCLQPAMHNCQTGAGLNFQVLIPLSKIQSITKLLYLSSFVDSSDSSGPLAPAVHLILSWRCWVMCNSNRFMSNSEWTTLTSSDGWLRNSQRVSKISKFRAICPFTHWFKRFMTYNYI